jgi:formate hydrogenlyase subunit 3/multisubunit Na+/H+ antiporter MnhD subunit
MLVGGLALVGLGPFAGLAANYAIAREASVRDPMLFAVLIVAHALALLAMLRAVWRIVRARVEEEDAHANRIVLLASVGVVIVIGVALVGAGMFPQMFEMMVGTLGQ